VQHDLEQGRAKRRCISESERRFVNFSQADTNNDGSIDKTEFDAACAKGLVKNPQ